MSHTPERPGQIPNRFEISLESMSPATPIRHADMLFVTDQNRGETIYNRVTAEQEKARQTAEWLNTRGLMNGAGMLQIDIASATIRDSSHDGFGGHDGALCDHNCDIGGGYQCPARRSANRGLSAKGLASGEQIADAITTGVAGLRLFNNRFVEGGSLDSYADIFRVPDHIRNGIAHNLMHGKVLCNAFGGNAEMHPELMPIVEACHKAGLMTTVTTTTGLSMSNSRAGDRFRVGLQAGYVDVLAMSIEAENAAQIRKFAQMSPEELRQIHRTVPYEFGQQRKAIEAFHTLQLQKELGGAFPDIVLNFVIYPSLLGEQGESAEEMIQAIHAEFPGVRVNPYLADSGFSYGEPIFSPEHVPALVKYFDRRLTEQRDGRKGVVQRPHCIVSDAAILATYKDDPVTASRMISGYGGWRCYGREYKDKSGRLISGAGSVVQIGANPHPRDLRAQPHAGLFLNCFWNPETILRPDRQVIDLSPAEVADHIDGGMSGIASSKKVPCPGCKMPRLKGPMHSNELGLNPALKDAYQEIRMQMVGF